MVFVDLEKAYNRVPRDLIWRALRKKKIPGAYITIIQDMYKATKTRVKTRCVLTQYFNIEVGLRINTQPTTFHYHNGRVSQQYSKRPTMGNALC